MRGLKRQQVAALTNFVGCFFSLYLLSFFSSKALNDLAGPSAGPLARKTYSIPSQRELSINLRETMAVQKGLLEFSSLLRGKTIALFCDNVTTVAYLRRSGGTRSQVLFLKAREILLWVESMKITLLPQFIQGSLNTRADLLSRPNLVIGSEWTLHQR